VPRGNEPGFGCEREGENSGGGTRLVEHNIGRENQKTGVPVDGGERGADPMSPRACPFVRQSGGSNNQVV